MTQDKSTPRPWKLCHCGKCGYIAGAAHENVACAIVLMPPIEGDPEITLAEHPYWGCEPIPRDVRQANAALIVQAVNSHDAMKECVEALKEISEWKIQGDTYAMRCIARSALSRLQAQGNTEWQPIETAPKDGTKVLLFFPGPFNDTLENGIVTGQWTGNTESWWLSSIWASSSAHQDPTYWASLPSRPKAAISKLEKATVSADLNPKG